MGERVTKVLQANHQKCSHLTCVEFKLYASHTRKLTPIWCRL